MNTATAILRGEILNHKEVMIVFLGHTTESWYTWGQNTDLSIIKDTSAPSVLLKRHPSLPREKLIRERNIHRKWKNHHGSEGPCSILQKLWVAQCYSRMQTAEEMKGRKSNPQIHPQFQACSSPVPRGQPFHSQREHNVVGALRKITIGFLI